MDQTQTPKYVSRIEPLLYVPTFTQKDSIMSTQDPHTGNLHRGICMYKVRSTQLLSPTQPPLHKRQGTKPKQCHLYTRGIKAQSQTPPQSPLHKRDEHKPKAKERLQLGDHNRPQTTLGDLNRPQTIFFTKTRSYR